jgi:hypothetical protein
MSSLKMNLDPIDILKLNAKLIIVGLTGYGQKG